MNGIADAKNSGPSTSYTFTCDPASPRRAAR
jgi:hypothetical protein